MMELVIGKRQMLTFICHYIPLYTFELSLRVDRGETAMTLVLLHSKHTGMSFL